MPERVPADAIAEASVSPGFADMVLLDRVLVIGPASFRIDEQSILFCAVIALTMREEGLHESRIKGDPVPGILRLHIGAFSMDHAALNKQGAVLEIQVRPFQRHDLACP